jgi:hypothetical protein
MVSEEANDETSQEIHQVDVLEEDIFQTERMRL